MSQQMQQTNYSTNKLTIQSWTFFGCVFGLLLFLGISTTFFQAIFVKFFSDHKNTLLLLLLMVRSKVPPAENPSNDVFPKSSLTCPLILCFLLPIIKSSISIPRKKNCITKYFINMIIQHHPLRITE